MNYIVKKSESNSYHYVEGLVKSPGDDAILIYHYSNGDIDTNMTTKEMMHSSLYDLYQCNDSLKKGDTFETEFGNFVCDGVHVLGSK